MLKFLKIIVIILSLFTWNLAMSQSISGYSISGAGGSLNSNILYDYNLGSISTSAYTGTYSVTSSVLTTEPNKDYNNTEDFNTQITTYPNPAKNFVNIVITSDYDINNIEIAVFDILGRRIDLNYNIAEMGNYTKATFDISSLDLGSYNFSIILNNSILKSVTLIKQ